VLFTSIGAMEKTRSARDDRARMPLHGHQMVKSREAGIACLPAPLPFP
jgi:hypothetical protein